MLSALILPHRASVCRRPAGSMLVHVRLTELSRGRGINCTKQRNTPPTSCNLLLIEPSSRSHESASYICVQKGLWTTQLVAFRTLTRLRM